jgi:hypothetical protein
MVYIAASDKFGVPRFLINSGAGDLAAKGQPLLRVHGSALCSLLLYWLL